MSLLLVACCEQVTVGLQCIACDEAGQILRASRDRQHLFCQPCVLQVQDGSIQYEVKLTGCLSTSVLSEGEGMDPTHGTLIAPHLNAQLHQHYFCVRLDMSVDDPEGGANLTVSEVSLPKSSAVHMTHSAQNIA